MRQTPAAYDFYKGKMRVSVNGETVAEFPPHYFIHIAQDLLKQVQEQMNDKQ